MTLSTDLDTWAADLGTATGLPVTRDPARIYPPCVFVGLPDTVAVTLPGVWLDVPVHLVAAGVGKPAGDQLLDNLTAFLTATGQKSATASPLSIGDTDFHAYQVTARITVTPDPPPPPPVEPVNPQLAVDNYADGFVRIQYQALLDDQQQHDGLTLGLAVVPATGGELLPDLNALEALHGDVWYDHNGTLGHVLTGNGQNLGPTMLARYIREGRTIDAQLDLVAQPPVFHIRFAHLPPTP